MHRSSFTDSLPSCFAARAGARFPLFPSTGSFPLDVLGCGVMGKPVEDCRGEDLVVEDLPPVDEALVRGDDGARLLVPAGEKPEEEPRLLPGHGKIPDIVDDEHLEGTRVVVSLHDPRGEPAGARRASGARSARTGRFPETNHLRFYKEVDIS